MRKLAVAGMAVVALLLTGSTVQAGHKHRCQHTHRKVKCHKVKHEHKCHKHERHTKDCGKRVRLDCGHKVKSYCHKRTRHLCGRKLFSGLFGCRKRQSRRCHTTHVHEGASEYAPQPAEGAGGEEVPAPPAEEPPAPPVSE